MKKLLLILFAFATSLYSQTLLLEENFDYGVTPNADITLVTSNWIRHSGSQGPAYLASNLIFPGYVSSNVGGAISHTKGGSGINDGDINRAFTEINTTNNIYVSFLFNCTVAQTTSDYFLHLGKTTIGTIFRGKVYVRANGSGFSFALSKTGDPIDSSFVVLNFNQTYLVVLKYSFNTATTSDDVVSLYVYDSVVPSSEPGLPIVSILNIGDGVADGLTNIGTIAIRQGATTPTGIIDGIRVATSWSQAPLPVELTNFDAMLVGNKVQLNWSTATEVNNYGFEILRSTQNDWEKIGFVAGHGNSNSPKDYSFTDANAPKGNVSYRLKQIDTDGSFSYSDVVSVNNALAKSFKLYSPYPNPFNPSTTIKYSIPSASNVSLKIYDVIGNEVASLVNEKKDAGEYEVNFNAKDLPSGIYFSTLRSNGNVQTQKLLLIK